MWTRISRTPQCPSQTARISSSDSPSIARCSSVNACSASLNSAVFSLFSLMTESFHWSVVVGSRLLRALRPRRTPDVKGAERSVGEAGGGGALDRAVGAVQQDGQAVQHRLHLVALRHQAVALVAEALHLGPQLVQARELRALVGRHQPRQLEGLAL